MLAWQARIRFPGTSEVEAILLRFPSVRLECVGYIVDMESVPILWANTLRGEVRFMFPKLYDKGMLVVL